MELPVINGSLRPSPRGTQVRIERTFPYPLGYVWEMLTEPRYLAQWLAPGTIEPRQGGRAKLDFIDSGIVIDSPVTEFEALHVVAYSWSGPGEAQRPLRFALEEIASGTRLRVALLVPKGEDAARAAAGFEAHLEMLAAALEGVPIKFPFQLFKELRAAYQTAGS